MHRASQPAHDRGRRADPRAARRRPAPLAGRELRSGPAVVAGPDRPRGEPQRPQRPAPTRGIVARGRAGDADRRTGSAATPRSTRSRPTWSASGPTPGSTRSPAPGSRSRSAARSTAVASRSSSTSCATPAPRRSAVGGVRVVTGVVVTGAPGAGAGRRRAPSATASTSMAIGAPDKLTGSLTRSGGVIAQLAATQPDVVVTVTPGRPARAAGDDSTPRPGARSAAPLIP